MCRTKWMMVLVLGLLHSTRFVRGGPTLTIEPTTKWYTATTLTVTCDLAGVTTSGLTFSQGSSVIYTCLFIGLTCGHKDGISDYSFVDWSQTANAIFTISNATKARDNGVWTCAGDSGIASSPVTSLSITDADCDDLTIAHGRVKYTSTTYGNTAEYECDDDYYLEGSSTRVCQANGSWSGEPPSCVDIPGSSAGTSGASGREGISILSPPSSQLSSSPSATTYVSETDNDKCECWYYWLFILVLIPCGGLVVVIIIVSRYKTLVISTLYVHVTKNIVKLSCKPKFEPVPNTTYATCAENGLTENAEFIDGLLVVEFRHLIPERQHDVIIYCQNPADMKLYKSETFTVFTLRDSSNTNPKESSPVLALHLLGLTVSQRNVGLSWTSPIAFESTKVEYWFGSGKHITISAKKPSQVTSNAEMTRLLPETMITFTITGEKDGTKYPSRTFHQKTLKD